VGRGAHKTSLARAAKSGDGAYVDGLHRFFINTSKKTTSKTTKNQKIEKNPRKSRKSKSKNIRAERKTQLKPMTQPPPFCSFSFVLLFFYSCIIFNSEEIRQ